MLNALRSLRAQPAIPVFYPKSSSANFPNNLCTKGTCGVRFLQSATGDSKPVGKMDQYQQQGKHPREENMDSFGEGYATRADEEGFGGVYGGNQELAKKEEEKIVYGKVTEFDTNQGCEVKEKEKARHQKGG